MHRDPTLPSESSLDLSSQIDELRRTRAELEQGGWATEAFHAISEGMTFETGAGFFRTLVSSLARAIQADFALVGELIPGSPARVRTLSLFADGQHLEDMTYELAGSPCETVVGKKVCSYASGVADLFPADTLLREIGVEGYVGVPLFDSHDTPQGIMVALFRRPLAQPARAEAVMQVFSTRTAAEMERMRTHAALCESEALLRATLEATADGILVVDRDRFVTSVNSRFLDMWRIPRTILANKARVADAELLSRVGDDLKDPAAFVARVEELYASAEPDFDTIHFRDERVFERYSCPLMRDGEIAGRVWSFRDVTSRRRAEEERRRIETQMLKTQKLESLGVLAGGIAHDFNNLLTTILCNADMAAATTAPSTRTHDHLREVIAASQRAAGLCRQMLAYAGGGTIVKRPLDVSATARELAGILDVSVSKKATFRLELGEDLPAVLGDGAQLGQVMMNLILNASEALEGDPGVISVATHRQDCGRAALEAAGLADKLREGVYVVLEVSDSGRGMDAATLERIFDPFFSTKFTGRGLGLAAVQGIVHAHDGAVHVESRPGEGTTFRVYLPACGGDVATVEDSRPATPGEPAHRTILVVDDEESIRLSGQMALEALGYRVFLAANGREAVETFRAQAGAIDGVLLDLTMPEMDGRETFHELRRLRPDVRVVLATGYAAQDVARGFTEDRLAGFIQKPYRPAELAEVMARALAA
ncbi:MAG: response regulator [Candidatus Eisenbacteria bacterium]|nr:response regulator [Candidatus Eisenbacteria bacterium]